MTRHVDEVERLHFGRDTTELPLFESSFALVRSTDPVTSHVAAAAIESCRTELQERVYAAFLELGPMSAKQAERLERFSDLGFSTVRKRASELLSAGWLRTTGKIHEGCQVYEVA